MFDYTKAFPEYNNLITYRFMIIVLGTFVFISGYFVGLKNISLNKHSIMQFYGSRLLRIYPLYLIAIVLFTFLNLSNLPTSIKAGFGISMLVKPAPLTLWFITMLLLFYAISPFLIHASRTIKMGKLVLYYIFLLLLLLALSILTNTIDDRVILYFPSFALGILVARKNIEFLKNNYFVWALILISFSILVSFINTPYGKINLLMKTPMVLSCSYFLFRVAKENIVFSKEISKKIAILSYSSYCMYLFHRPVIYVIKKIYFPETHFYQVVYLIGFCLPFILLSSFTIQRTYDIAMNMLINKYSERKKSELLS